MVLAEGTARPNHVLCDLRIRRERTGSTEGGNQRQAASGRTSCGSACSFYPRCIILRSDARPNPRGSDHPFCLVQVVAEGPVPEVKPKDAGVPMEVRRRKIVRRRGRVRRRWSDVEDNGHLCHSLTVLTVASWRQSVAEPSCTKEESRSVKSERAAKQEISLGAMRSNP